MENSISYKNILYLYSRVIADQKLLSGETDCLIKWLCTNLFVLFILHYQYISVIFNSVVTADDCGQFMFPDLCFLSLYLPLLQKIHIGSLKKFHSSSHIYPFKLQKKYTSFSLTQKCPTTYFSTGTVTDPQMKMTASSMKYSHPSKEPNRDRTL